MDYQTSRARFGHRAGVGKTAVIAGVALVLVAGVGGYLALRSRGEPAEVKTTETAEVVKGGFDITTVASGELESRNKVELRSPLEREAAIVTIVEEGTRVKSGDVIVRLNTEDIEQRINEEMLQVERTRSDLVSAENAYSIQLNENESKMREARLKVDLAELSLSNWREGEAAIKRQEQALAIERATVELERLAQKFAKSQELLEAGFLSKDECDRDEVQYIEAISRWNTSRLASEVYDLYQYPRDEREKISAVDEARAALERVRLNSESELASRDANRRNQRQQLAIREQRLARLREQLAACVIRAPQDGLVVYGTTGERRGGWGGGSDTTLQVGTKVFPNQLLVVLPDTSDMLAAIRVQESISGRIRPGQEATVTVDAAGNKSFTGRVDSIGVMAETGGWRDPNLREYTVRIALDIGEARELLKPSMRAEARVLLGKVQDVAHVPVQAVFQEGVVRYTLVENDGVFTRVPVRVGRRSDARAEIVAGLTPGQRVLIREPKAGEVADQPFSDDQLKLAGYKRLENGQIAAEGAEPTGPGGPPRGRRNRETAGKGPEAAATPKAEATAAPKAETPATGS